MTAQYCDPQDVRNLLSGLDPQGQGTAAELPDDKLTEAIVDASTMVTSYTGTDWTADQYNPNPVVPQMVQSLTTRLAAYYATLMYRRGKELTPQDPIYLMYLDIRQTFKDIITGKIEVNPGRPNEAPEHQGNVRQTIPSIFAPSDAGVKISQGAVTPSGPLSWGGYSPSPWTGYDQTGGQ